MSSRPSADTARGGPPVSGGGRERPFRLQFLLGALFVLAAAVLILPGLRRAERRLHDRLEEAQVERLRRMMGGMVRGMEIRVVAAERRVARFARLLSEEPAGPDPALVREFDALVRRDPDGAWRSRKERFDPLRETGIFVPNFTRVDPAFKSFVIRAKRLTERFGAGALDPVLADAWVGPAAGGQFMFVPDQPDFVYEETADHDYRPTEWLRFTHPDENPAGVPRWTNPYHSIKTDAWFVSIVAPFTVAGRYAGAVGQDLSPAELVDFSAQTPVEAGARFMVIGPRGGILFADSTTVRGPSRPEGQQLANLPDAELRDTLIRLVAAVPRAARGAQALTRTSSAYLISSAMPRTGWLAVALIPRSSVVAPLTEPLRTARLAVLGGLLVLSIASLIAVTREIRRRQRIADATRRAEERFRDLFQLSPDGVVVTRQADGQLVEVNDSFMAMAGYTREELIGRTTLELGLWADPADRAEVLGLLTEGGVCRNVPIQVRRKDGAIISVDFTARHLDIDGMPCLLSIIRDMEERRRLERQLALAQRMEAVGRLAGGVAHDFNNILTAVMGYAQLALEGQPPGSPVAEDLREILRAGRRAADLTQRLLSFSRRQVTQPRDVDLNGVVQEARKLSERLLGADVALVVVAGESLPPVRIDPGQLEQVLLNLMVNARDAMPSGGSVTVATSARDGQVTLEVTDTGTGIPVEQQPRIFEPFFTTKEVGKGTGLGLATCYGIIQQAGGRIEFSSEPGRGTTFRVLLPASRGALAAGEPPAAPVAVGLQGGEETVLLAEDEPQVRELAIRALAALGYRVLVAANGAEALRVAAEHPGAIPLLVSDVVMPGMSGSELARRLRQARPGLRVLFVSGYAEDSAELEAAMQRGDGFLAKPFGVVDLARRVREALDGEG